MHTRDRASVTHDVVTLSSILLSAVILLVLQHRNALSNPPPRPRARPPPHFPSFFSLSSASTTQSLRSVRIVSVICPVILLLYAPLSAPVVAPPHRAIGMRFPPPYAVYFPPRHFIFSSPSRRTPSLSSSQKSYFILAARHRARSTHCGPALFFPPLTHCPSQTNSQMNSLTGFAQDEAEQNAAQAKGGFGYLSFSIPLSLTFSLASSLSSLSSLLVVIAESRHCPSRPSKFLFAIFSRRPFLSTALILISLISSCLFTPPPYFPSPRLPLSISCCATLPHSPLVLVPFSIPGFTPPASATILPTHAHIPPGKTHHASSQAKTEANKPM
ncbi:hypothetical protein B0H19DRAFT_1270274 [Mycena capillaripes]|nr:hypothetical protein B0H19DRAFT_1270274 [Mycena capillaripes]